MAKLVQALLSIIDGVYMGKAIWKYGKVDIYIFFEQFKINEDTFHGVQIGNIVRVALVINYFQLLVLLIKFVTMKAIH